MGIGVIAGSLGTGQFGVIPKFCYLVSRPLVSRLEIIKGHLQTEGNENSSIN